MSNKGHGHVVTLEEALNLLSREISINVNVMEDVLSQIEKHQRTLKKLNKRLRKLEKRK